MEDYQQIENELITTLGSEDKSGLVTYYGVKGVLRGFITAVALKIRDLYYSISQTTRKLFVDTSSGTDLDSYTLDHGVEPRLGATKAGTILVFSGASGTVIPQGTIVKHSISNLGYATVAEITLGTQNLAFAKSDGTLANTTFSIADSVWAECVESGSTGNCPQGVITKCSITGVTATNATPAQGGTDSESDESLRDRNKNYVKLLNQGTETFYEELAKEADSRVLRAFPYKNYTKPDTINIVIITGSGVSLTTSDLVIIATYIQSKCRAYTKIICENIVFTPIYVDFRVSLKSVNGQAIDMDTYFTNISDRIASYLDWSTWKEGGNVSYDDILTICENTPQTDDIDLLNFKVYKSVDEVPNNPVIAVSQYSLPYFTYLKITATNVAESTGINPRINTAVVQNYTALLNKD